jgi:anti-sigma regulatory factor (Ser/Thr protein kinase)
MEALATEDVFQVAAETDRFWCGREVRRFARAMGFGERAQWELAIVAAELVSNAVRYAAAGTLTLRTTTGPRAGMEIVVADRGGEGWRVWAARRGLGLGLRTVRCLSHAVSIERAPNGGTVVTAARYLAP